MDSKSTENMDEAQRLADLKLQINETTRLISESEAGVKKQREQLASLEAKISEIDKKATKASNVASSEAEQIVKLRQGAENLLIQIEADARKANSESGFAFNAKGNAEEHAKAIAQVRGTVESTFSGLTATKTQTDEAAKAIIASRSAADADAKAINEIKGSVTEKAAQIVAANDRVTAVLPSIEIGSKDANAITAAKAGAEASATAIQQLQTQITEAKVTASADSASISKAEAESKKLLVAMTEAQNTANEANARLTTYEEELAGMLSSFSAMQTKLEGLLPHATSAGLASAFHAQKSRFSKPQKYWLGLFVTTIVALLISAIIGLPASDATWDVILRHLVNRLPIIGPLIWLAIYAGHHYSMALRMEEDYAFKEAVSTAFEGYKREMLGIQSTNGTDISPLIRLCENVLQALAERPGRIYDGKIEVPTPLTPATAMLKDMLSAWKSTNADK